MDVKTVLETIKNLNLTFDGKLNSETLAEIVKTVAPYYTWYLIKGFTLQVIGMALGTVCVYWIAKAIKDFGKKDE